MKFCPILYLEICAFFIIVGILFGKRSQTLETSHLKAKLIYFNLKDGIALQRKQ